MKKTDWLKTWYHEIILIILLIGLLILKIPHLSLPYYGDEGFAFGPAVHLMFQNGPTMLPEGLDPEYSYGHPLLFHFLVASWMKIFGESIFVAKSFALTISVFFLISLFFIGRSVFNKDTGLLAVILLMSQPVFLAQASFVLPEILLAFFGIWTMYFFYTKKWLFFVAAGSLLVMTKESGLFLIFSLCIWNIIDIFIEKEENYSGRKFFLNFLVTLTPALVFGLFLIKQKLTYGWFFFPLRMNDLRLNQDSISHMLWNIRNIVFYTDGRNWLTIGLFISILFYYFFAKSSFKLCQWKLIWFSVIFTAVFLLISALNVVSNRYFLIIITIIILVTASILIQALQHNKLLLYPLMTILILTQVFYTLNRDRNGDDNLGYLDGVNVHLNAVRFMEHENLFDERIYAHFLMLINLNHPLSGYLSSGRVFTDLTGNYNDYVKYAVISSVELTPELDSIRHSQHLELMKRFENGNAWTEIYKNKLRTN